MSTAHNKEYVRLADAATEVLLLQIGNHMRVPSNLLGSLSVAELAGAPDPDETVRLASVQYCPDMTDMRTKKEKRAGRKKYRKAVASYGKTYTFTRNQVLCSLAAMVGFSMVLSALLLRVYIWLMDLSNLIVR